jgi:DNA modification methylase
MVTKEYIEELKENNLPQLYRLLDETKDSREVLFILKNLGAIPKDFSENFIKRFVDHSNEEIRLWAVKNLGKISNPELIDFLSTIIQNDPDSMVRREAVSSIGRMRFSQGKSILIELLNDADPKIILQAIRGLLVFKEDQLIRQELIKLRAHPNEIIQDLIKKEFFPRNNLSQNKIPHFESPDFLKNVVVNSDVREVLKYIPNESIHLTFTSPPYYNARDYSIYSSYHAYLEFLTDVFSQIHRITKEGRFLIINTSPIIIPRISRTHASKRYGIPFDLHGRLVENGWEFIDDIIWLKPESSVKNRNSGFLQHRKPLGYKPNLVTEYLMVYRKKTDKLLDWNMGQYDSNIVEESRVVGNYETSNVWQIDPTSDRVHSAVFPVELCNRVIRFYSYIGDLIFDPFGGSGTLGKSAQNLRRYFFLTEQEKNYVERMKYDLAQMTLFETKETKFLTLEEFIKVSKVNC